MVRDEECEPRVIRMMVLSVTAPLPVPAEIDVSVGTPAERGAVEVGRKRRWADRFRRAARQGAASGSGQRVSVALHEAGRR